MNIVVKGVKEKSGTLTVKLLMHLKSLSQACNGDRLAQ